MRRAEFNKLERTFTLPWALCYSTITYCKDAWQSEKAARVDRAARLREQISSLKKQDHARDDSERSRPEESEAETGSPKSPRDLIREKMRELDEAEP